jgi:rhodanese-related sulfurtransferase
MSSKSSTDLVNEAKQQIENLSPNQVKEELSKGNVTLIDIRESEELKQIDSIPGSIEAPRGMLEFYADPSLPAYHKPEFERSKRIILTCATGGRSALAALSLKQMGYENVAHLDGGLKAWQDAGLPVNSPNPQQKGTPAQSRRQTIKQY